MKRITLSIICAVALLGGWYAVSPSVHGQVPFGPVMVHSPDGPPQGPGSEPRLPDFNSVVRGAKEHEGLFKLYHKDDKVYMELRPDQLNKPVLCPIAVARGGGMGGSTLNFEEQWVLLFKRVGDKVHVIRRNVHFKAKPGTPAAKAVETTYSDSVIQALRVVAVNPQRQAALIDLNEMFMTDFAQLGLGHFDSSRSTWNRVKGFPRNVELQVQATYAGGGRRAMMGDDSVIDPRGNTVVIHYSLADLPDSGYQPRVADDRVGYFVTAARDFSSDSRDTTFVRYVNRWRLERAEPLDPKNPTKLSVPKKSIKYYIEKTVPHEYRAAVQDGILEWNKAYEKIGFRNAIEVVQQRDDEEFDPEDMNYNTFRWITTGNAFAMGPSRANPLTGEILDADIVFDADLVRNWKHEQQVFNASGIAIEPVSPIQALDLGWGLQHQLLNRGNADLLGWNETPRRFADDLVASRLRAIQQGVCQCGTHMRSELSMAALAMMDRVAAKPGDKITDELVQQAVKMVVMHEVGHTLGLRHNFKGSTMFKHDQLHDTKLTREKGLVGSVMDYTPVNLAPKGVKQGDYFTTTLGPYDYWAIEYGYRPFSGNEADELKKIANQGAKAGNDYGTDEDTFLSSDPNINRWDMGADVMKFAQERIMIAEDLMKTLANNVVDEGEGYQRARVAFSILMSQFGNGAYLVSKYVGAEHAYRDHRGDPNAREPLVPVNSAKQREALKFLAEHILSDKSFQFPPDLLRKLAVERWYHWGARPSSTDFPLHERILGIQKVAMNQVLNPSVLRRVQDNALKVGKDDQPLTIAEIFRTVTDGIWGEQPNGNGAAKDDKLGGNSIVRRNLQREHVKKLSDLVLGPKAGGQDDMAMMMMVLFGDEGSNVPPDARALARSHLREIGKRIQTMLTDRKVNVDETTLAHLEECRERIAKVLDASMQLND